MPMYIVLNEYLTRLSNMESKKPKEEQKHVPTLTELANSIGIHRTNLSKLANNKSVNLNLETGDKIILEMRRLGFSMQTTDLIIHRDPNTQN